MQELVTEVSSIGSCRHRHVLAIKGIHVSKQNILMVYDYMPNGSLDDHLFAPPTSSPTSPPAQGCSPSFLDWNTRQNIALGTAKGLAYLHEVRSTFLRKLLKMLMDGMLLPRGLCGIFPWCQIFGFAAASLLLVVCPLGFTGYLLMS
jgi:serine/threonine protein kinase